MLTRDEVIQLILYLIVASVLMLAAQARGDTIAFGNASGAGSGAACDYCGYRVVSQYGHGGIQRSKLPSPKNITLKNARKA